MGPVGFVPGFLLNQACQNQHFVGVFIGQPVLPAFPCLIQAALHCLVCGFVNLQVAATRVNFVTVGEKLTFRIPANRVRCDFGHQFFITPPFGIVFDVLRTVDCFAHMGKARPFDNLYGNQIRPAAAHFLQNIPSRHFRRQSVRTRVQPVMHAQNIGRRHQYVPAVHDAVFGKLLADQGNTLVFGDFNPVRSAVILRNKKQYRKNGCRHGQKNGRPFQQFSQHGRIPNIGIHIKISATV